MHLNLKKLANKPLYIERKFLQKNKINRLMQKVWSTIFFTLVFSIMVFAQHNDHDFLVEDEEDMGSLYYHSHNMNEIAFEGPYDYKDNEYDNDHLGYEDYYSHTLEHERSDDQRLRRVKSNYSPIKEDIGLDVSDLPSQILDDHTSYYKAYSNHDADIINIDSSPKDTFINNSRHKHYFGGNYNSIERLHNNREGWNDFE